MLQGPALENLAAAIEETCRSGVDPDSLRPQVLRRLRRAVPVDALWWAIVDPATLLFTQSYREEIPEETGQYFVENEFLQEDVNKWTDLARDRDGVRTLLQATDGQVTKSARYRDIFRPLGLEDELRAVLRVHGTAWGYLCLHRGAGSGFSREELQFVNRIAPTIAEGIRLGMLISALQVTTVAASPGLVMLAGDSSVAGMNQAGEQWLEELRGTSAGSLPPIEVYTVAARLRGLRGSEAAAPRLRVRTRAGRWALLHASWMPGEDGPRIAVTIDEAPPAEVAPLLMAAYGMTKREQTVTGLVCRGFSTRQISASLHVTTNTVQDHLKSIFEKTGVRSRRELAATILQRDFLPRTRSS